MLRGGLEIAFMIQLGPIREGNFDGGWEVAKIKREAKLRGCLRFALMKVEIC
jgi:hypothetical protein